MSISIVNSIGQSSKQKKITTQFFIGISIQKFALQQWVKPSSNAALYLLGAEQNPEGFGIEIPIEFYFNELNFGLLINPILRYDVTKPVAFGGTGIEQEKSLFADMHLSIFRKQYISKYFKQPLKIGIGYSFISPFLAFENPAPPLIPYKEIKLDFEGPHVFLSVPIGNLLYIKQQFTYIPKGQIMYLDYSKALMYHLSIKLDPKAFKRKRNK